MVSITSSQINPRPPAQRAPQSSSGPEPPHQVGHLPLRLQNKHRVDLSQHQADQRNANKPKLGENVNPFLYVMSAGGYLLNIYYTINTFEILHF